MKQEIEALIEKWKARHQNLIKYEKETKDETLRAMYVGKLAEVENFITDLRKILNKHKDGKQ